jgi:putative ABC transport system permease protein
MGQELRHALRRLRCAPGYTLAAVAMLALGIGLSVAMYSTLNGVLLRGLPFSDGDRVVLVNARHAVQGIDDAQFTIEEAEALNAGTAGFSALAYYWWSGVTLFDGELAREITTHMVGPGYFAALGVEPVLGRVLSDEDILQDRRLALLSHAEWQRSFAGSAAVIGRQLDLVDEDPLEVIGVLPPQLDLVAADTGLWRPLSPRLFPTDGVARSSRRLLPMLGRLQPGVSAAQADAALSSRITALHAGGDATESGWTAASNSLLDVLVGDARTALWGAFALSGLVLLIASANVAILMDARLAARRREVAVMQAIGASRSRLQRERMLELLALAALAVGAGLAIALAAIEALRDLARDSIPRVDGIVMDWQVFGFAVLLGVTAPLFAALAGSLRVQAAPADAIRGGARGVVGQRGGRRMLPALAMALSTVSLVAAFTLVGGLWRLQHVDAGYATARVHAMQFFRGGTEAFLPFTEGLLERIDALPGVDQVALTSAAPRSGIGSASVDVRLLGQASGEATQAGLRRVSAGYRALLDIPLLAGREFSAEDRRGAPSVALVNQSFARRVFGDADPLGQRLSLPIGPGDPIEFVLIGVVADIRNDGLRSAPAPEVLVSFAQHPINAMTFLARSALPLPGIERQMAAELQALDPRQAITRQYVLADDLAEELRPAGFFARTVGAFAVVALLLAVLGVYAVASLQQRRRIGEFGLRIAVGANPRHLALSLLRDSTATSSLGILVGLVLVAILLQGLDMRALGIEPGVSPWVLAAALAAMAFAALLAAGVPAWRATRVDPMTSLRHD